MTESNDLPVEPAMSEVKAAPTTTTTFDSHPGRGLGKMAPLNRAKQLHFSQFADPLKKGTAVVVPPSYNYWKGKTPFDAHSFGNVDYGDCTRASQAICALRLERIEQRRTLVIPPQGVIDAYFAMTDRLYGGGDTGAYESDALDCWRRSDQTFKDSKGNPLTIDAYVKVDHTKPDEVCRAIFTAGAHAVKICFALPNAWSGVPLDKPWDGAPAGTPETGDWEPYSWGGHSMICPAGYDKTGITIAHSWFDGKVPYTQKVTWAGTAYCDEMYVVIDSVDSSRKQAQETKFDITNLVKAVNAVSSVPIEKR